MAEKVVMLALSPTMDEGTIVKWNVKVGDSVALNQVICEVETDKATMEYESVNEGTILKLVKLEGQGAKVGSTIAIIGEKDEDISALEAEVEKDQHDESQKQENVPQQQNIPIESTPKSSVADTQSTTATAKDTPPMRTSGVRVKASPLARKLAKERGVVLESIQGTGPNGRITSKDVLEAKPGMMHKTGLGNVVVSQDIHVPVKGVRAIIASRLSESKFSAPHFYVKNEVRTESMMSLRAQMNAGLKEKLSLNAFIIKFAAEAIKQYPDINSSWQGDHIIQYASIDIGLAVDLGDGLFTPIVRNCGNKGIATIDSELKKLIEKVKNKTITTEEYSGATFTISNLGSFGVDEFTAIINPPGAAILAVGRGRKVPVVNESGELEVGNVMTLTLSSDHRVIDGSLAGRFIAKLKAIIENQGVALL